jgi:hypothetical protein
MGMIRLKPARFLPAAVCFLIMCASNAFAWSVAGGLGPAPSAMDMEKVKIEAVVSDQSWEPLRLEPGVDCEAHAAFRISNGDASGDDLGLRPALAVKAKLTLEMEGALGDGDAVLKLLRGSEALSVLCGLEPQAPGLESMRQIIQNDAAAAAASSSPFETLEGDENDDDLRFVLYPGESVVLTARLTLDGGRCADFAELFDPDGSIAL